MDRVSSRQSEPPHVRRLAAVSFERGVLVFVARVGAHARGTLLGSVVPDEPFELHSCNGVLRVCSIYGNIFAFRTPLYFDRPGPDELRGDAPSETVPGHAGLAKARSGRRPGGRKELHALLVSKIPYKRGTRTSGRLT